MLQIVWRDMCRFIQPYVIITIEMRHRNKLVSQFYIKLRNQNTDLISVSFFVMNLLKTINFLPLRFRYFDSKTFAT